MPRAGTVAAAALAAAVALAVLHGGGSDPSRLVAVGALALAGTVWAWAATALGSEPRPRLGGSGVALGAASAALVAWTGLSVAWSIAPERSWDAFNRGLAYLAVAAAAAAAGALLPRARERLAALLAALSAVAVVWGLAGKIVPALGPDAERSARLHEPVGYWNALALLLAMALPLWLWLAAERARPAILRAAAGAAVVPTVVALVLTGSRGGLLVAAAAVAAWLALARERVEGAVALAVSLPLGVAVSAWTLTRPGLTDAGVESARRARDGALLGGLLAAAVAAALGAGYALARAHGRSGLGSEPRRRLGRALAGAGVVVTLAILLAGALRVDDPAAWAGDRVAEFTNPPDVQVSQDVERLGSFSSNHRWTWWTESWRIFRDRPLRGAGAGTFELARRPYREDTRAPLAPHNLGLQALAETGAVGLALLLLAAGAGVLVVAGALRRLDGRERAASAALAAGLAAWSAHALVDMGWEFAAVTVPAWAALGALASAGRPPRPASGRRNALSALAAAAVAATALVSLALPWLAERRVDDAVAAVGRGDLRAAERDARSAAGLNPLAVRPVLLRASVYEAAGRLDRAEALYRAAVRLQPENPDTWYELGRFLHERRRDPQRALVFLDRGYALDAFHPEIPRLLNEVRAAIARGG